MVISEIPSTPPTVRNIPRSPVIVATFSGINSMHALFEGGIIIPTPIPAISIREARKITFPPTQSTTFQDGTPCPRTTVVIEAMIKPQIMGFRYPHRVRKKLVTAAAAMPPSDLGVKIIPLSSVERQ